MLEYNYFVLELNIFNPKHKIKKIYSPKSPVHISKNVNIFQKFQFFLDFNQKLNYFLTKF